MENDEKLKYFTLQHSCEGEVVVLPKMPYILIRDLKQIEGQFYAIICANKKFRSSNVVPQHNHALCLRKSLRIKLKNGVPRKEEIRAQWSSGKMLKKKSYTHLSWRRVL